MSGEKTKSYVLCNECLDHLRVRVEKYNSEYKEETTKEPASAISYKSDSSNPPKPKRSKYKKAIAIFGLAALMCFIIVFSISELVSLSNDSDKSYRNNKYDTNSNYEEDVDSFNRNNTTTKANAIHVQLRSDSFTFTDNNGYVYKVTVKLSPWILNTNIDAINSAANSVGSIEKTLPQTPSEWMSYWKIGKGLFNNRNITNLYILLGNITVENITDGWGFSSENPGTPSFECRYPSWFYADVFYSNGNFDSVGARCSIDFYPYMERDRWDVSFVLGKPESVTPSDPNGFFRDQVDNNVFIFGTYNSNCSITVNLFE